MIPTNINKECLENPMNQRFNHSAIKKNDAIMLPVTNGAPIKTVLVHLKNKAAPDWVGNGGINTGIISLEEV